MSTLAEISLPKSRRSPVARILLWLLLAVVSLVVAAIAYAYYVAHSALPQLDGQLRVSGISAPVSVTRDSHGVPTIEAVSLEDLFFSQGYVTAQDRLWQMDIMRRYGSGELAEILGEDLLKLDREQRILGLRAAARKALEMANPRDRNFFEAYARGVNAYIDAHRDHLPLEFRILRYEPKPWLAEDSVVVANSMVKDLNYHYFYDALSREKILAKLGPELTADLYVNRSWHDRPPTVMREDLNESDSAAADSDDDDNGDDDPMDNSVTQNRIPVEASPEGLPVNGSNDWVVSGAHTVTGKPLLSNDMHLGHQMPNLWYEAHLHAGTSGRCGGHAAGNAVRDCRTQSADCVGIHERWSDGDRCLHRELQRAGRVPDSGRLGAAGPSHGSDSRQGEARCQRRREDHSAWPDHHRTGAGRNPATGAALDAV